MKEVLSYLLSIGGAGIVAYAVMLAAGVNTDYPAARFRIINSLRTQPWQAEVMTKTKPGSFYDGIHAAMKTGGMMGLRDPEMIAMGTRPAYDAAAISVGFKWKAILGKLKMGAVGVVGGLVLAIGVHTMPALHIILAVIGIGAGIWIFVTKNDCERYVMLARLEILPDVDRAIAEGRYGKPPIA
ncbi:MAG: hypothetical protein ABI678_16475 [Kofleriaceae bacterium]